MSRKKIDFEGIHLMKMAAEMSDRDCQANHQNKAVDVEGILPKTETAVESCHGNCRKEMAYAANCLRRANVNLVPSGWVISPVNRGDVR